MIFKPNTVACLWDTWLYHHAGKHYLFYLFNSRTDAYWDGIGMAVSDDGVHFTDLGRIIRKPDDAMWLGTGMTWRAVDGSFMLNFSINRAGRQEIEFAESDDLLHWRVLPHDEYVCRSNSRWYADKPALSSHRWDCIWVLPRDDGQGYVGFLTAVAREGPPGLCGTAGCVTSDDGKHFRAAPPVIETGFWGDRVEVGAVEKIDGRYYMLLGVFSMPLGARQLARVPGGECGMFVVSADVQTGPYRLNPNQRPLLSGSPNPSAYFARFYRIGQDLLVNHHTVARSSPMVGYNAGPDVHLSPLKAVHHADGILSLRWWPGNEALKGKRLPISLEGCTFTRGIVTDSSSVQGEHLKITAPSGGIAIMPTHLNWERGAILEANLTLTDSTGPLSGVGFFIEGKPHETGTLLLAQSDGRLSMGPYDGYSFKPEYSPPSAIPLRQSAHWKLLLRDTFVELYVDDAFVQCHTLPHAPSGRAGFVVEAGAVAISNVCVWEMSL